MAPTMFRCSAPSRRRLGSPACALAASLFALWGCASLGLGSVIQPPAVSSVEGRDPELRLTLPGSAQPAGGAAIRLWCRIENPNDFSLTIVRLAGDLFIGDAQGVAVEFPLGVPLARGGDTIVPLDVSLDFDDVPALGEAALRAVTSGTLPYRLEALIGVDAGLLGQPTFGPSTLLRGELRVVG